MQFQEKKLLHELFYAVSFKNGQQFIPTLVVNGLVLVNIRGRESK